jgi:hypothetical protein
VRVQNAVHPDARTVHLVIGVINIPTIIAGGVSIAKRRI